MAPIARMENGGMGNGDYNDKERELRQKEEEVTICIHHITV